MRDILVTLIVFSSLPVTLFRPWVGVLVFAWISYMNPHRLSWGFAYDMPFAAMIAAATLVGLVLTRDRKAPPLNAVTVVWGLWILWMNVTTFFAMLPADALVEWQRTMKIQLMALVTIMLMQSKQRTTWLVYMITASIGFYGVKGGVFALLTGGNFRVFGPPDTFYAGNNGLAAAVLMTLPLVRYLQLQATRKWIRLSLYGVMGLMAMSVLASYSRGAFLGAVAVAFYIAIKSRSRFIFVPLLIVVGIGAMNFMPQHWYERIVSIQTYQEDGSAMGRINAWYFAINVAKERPLVGGGYNVFDPELFHTYAPDPKAFHDSHSIYFEALGEQGFVGLGLFLLLGVLAFRLGSRTRRLARDVPGLAWASDLASMIQVSLVAYAVAGAFLGMAYWDLYYHLIGIVLLARAEVDRVLREAAEPIPAPNETTIEAAGVSPETTPL